MIVNHNNALKCPFCDTDPDTGIDINSRKKYVMCVNKNCIVKLKRCSKNLSVNELIIEWNKVVTNALSYTSCN